MPKKHLLTILLLSGITSMLAAQPGSEKARLERERQEIQNELKQVQGMYDRVKNQKNHSLGQLNMLKKKINLQEQYMNSINKELKMIDNDIYLSNLEIYRLQKQVDTLKVQYARTVVYAYKNRSSYDYVDFIFSATSFNDAIRRVVYLKSYRNYREKQVNTILETLQLIAKRQQQQLGRKEQKSVALKEQVKEKTVLDVQRQEKDKVVSELKSKEKDLKKEIATKKKRDREIRNAIDAIVRSAIAKAAEVGDPVIKKTKSYLDLNATDVALNSGFEKNRGKLPWPVDNGVVLIPFGKYSVEGFKGIIDNNPGVTIGTPNAGVSVKAVFDGEVAAIHNYGDGALIVIRHGKYFTSYSNLSAVNVSKGTIVKRGQVIGKAGEDENGAGGKVDFMLMIENNNVNPEPWFRH